MLTLGKSNTTQAKNYYKQENYYSQEEAGANSQWQGKGASGYQLSGAITDLVAYDNIVNGLSPDGKTQLRQKQSHDSKKERAATDLTFSAPKSVSIACLVGGDTRLEEAHRIAVSRTIDLIESRYATTRINGQPVQTDNLIVAKWHHDTSRELDPHLHTHCLVMNCTQGPDGKWRSINNKAFYQHKMLLGQIYRNELALECRKLGYEIEPHPQELFEIKGYTREQIEGFSKRHEQIKNKLIEMGAELTCENKAWAWRKTRAKKNHEIRREEKLPYWQQEADLYGITHPVPVHGQAPTSISNEQNEQITQEIKLAVDFAIEHCSERQVAFTREDIEKFVTAEVKPFSVSQLEQEIAQHPELIKTYDGRRYTTQTALATELATIRLMQQGKGLCSAIANPETIDSYLADKKLTSGQRSAVALSATTSDQFIAWQGVAGAGKTYALNAVKEVTTALGQVAPEYIIKGFAPSAEAAKVLGEELGIEANTVARLLVSQQVEKPPPNQIWIVDEAGLLSAKNAHALLERATQEKARVILVGSTRQLSAIEAGNPFKSLQSAGIATAHLDESLRQKPPDLQKAVGLAANGQIGEALSHLHQLERIEEVASSEERTTKIAADYIKLPPKERQQTLIVAGTHLERTAITEEIRTALKEEGTLGYGVKVTQLRARQNLTAVQTRYTHNYNVGDVVVPVRDYKRLGLHKALAYKVEAIEGDKLHLSDLAGNSRVVDPMKFRKTLYNQENIDIAVGDRLRWTRNDKELGRRNGQEFTVTSIDGQTATIELQGGKTDTIDLYGPLHLDHALVATTYSSQGKTANRVLVSSTVDATVSQESVYVAISRAKYDLKIYAENINYLLEEAQESKAQETVLELLQPKAKVQVAAAPERTVTSSVKQSVGVTATPKVTFEEESSVSSIERPLKRQNQQAAKPTPSPTFKPHAPKQLEVFWQPNSDRSCPPHIEAKHWRELVEGSAIHPDIAALNFRSLQMGSIEQEHQAWEYLMYSHKLERTNTGQLTTGYLKRYAHIESGGWWCNSGANALSFSNKDTGNKPQEKIWGCYKPNQPRNNPDKPGKVIKYEHPPKTDLGIFLLDVPEYIAQKIYQKAGVDPSQEDRDRGFWYCVWKYNLPIVVTEGAKKAASLLSQGHAAIGLPGIYAGYRSKDEQGNPIKAHLHEELAAFATLGRSITFCFDYETRPETKRNIEIAISRTGSLLRQQGVKVSVVNLPGSEKGVDDLIVAHSPLAFEQQLVAALPLREWWEVNKQQRQQGIAPPKKLTIAQKEEKLNQSLSGQLPANTQDLNQLQEQNSHDSIKHWLKGESTADGRNTGTDGDRQFDSQHGRSESSEHQLDPQHRRSESPEPSSIRGEHKPDSQHRRSESPEPSNLRPEQGTQKLQPQTVGRYTIDSQADVGRLHRSIQSSLGATEIGQTERNTPRIDRSNEQSLAQAGGYQHSSDPSEGTGDGGLRGDRQPAEATPQQREEVTTANNGQWAQALGKLAQVLQSANNERVIKNAGLERQLITLTKQLKNLNPQQVKYEFTGLSELARSLSQQQLQNNAVENLEQIQPSLSKLTRQLAEIAKLTPEQVVDLDVDQACRDASALIRQLQPGIEKLAGAINQWQRKALVTRAIAGVGEIAQQLEQRNTFDFGNLPRLINEATTDQLLSRSGLACKLATLTQQLKELTPKPPTKFEGMSALAENLQAVQAESQLLETKLTEQLNAFSSVVDNFNPQPVRYEEDSKTLGELTQQFYSFNTRQQLSESGLLKQLLQTTDRAISAISQHNEQLQEDLSMLQTVKKSKAFNQANIAYTQENVNTLAQQLRDLPLDEIAIRLGLTQDKHDKHKWRGEGQIISINDQKFYDHANLKGGYGAIDLVMHVQAREFKEALGWLADSALELPPVPVREKQTQVTERQRFQPPSADESKWLAVRQYLVEKRQLPAALVDELHNFGKVYADAKQNAVFLRQDVDGNLTGASLRGTYNGSSFKGLSTGSLREGGWFSFVQGEGELKRIVIVESAIDALSAAALSKQQRRTMFVSTDGAGSVPVSWLKQQQQQGVEIVAAHDSDLPGEAMAWRLATELGVVTRATPTVGKDWNEHLLGIGSQPDVSGWKLVAQAIGKPDAYTGRIEAVIASGQPLPIEAVVAMRLDFNTYKQTASDLWQWHQAARDIGKSDAYLERISEVAIAFHHSKSPMPLTQQATATMQQDLLEREQLLESNSLWQHNSSITDLTRPMKTDFAHTDTKDSPSLQQERLNIRAVQLSIRLLSEFSKQQNSKQVSWTGGWYTFTKVGSDIKVDCSQRQSTILDLSDGNLQGSITQRDVEKFEQVLEAIKNKEIVKQAEL